MAGQRFDTPILVVQPCIGQARAIHHEGLGLGCGLRRDIVERHPVDLYRHRQIDRVRQAERLSRFFRLGFRGIDDLCDFVVHPAYGEIAYMHGGRKQFAGRPVQIHRVDRQLHGLGFDVHAAHFQRADQPAFDAGHFNAVGQARTDLAPGEVEPAARGRHPGDQADEYEHDHQQGQQRPFDDTPDPRTLLGGRVLLLAVCLRGRGGGVVVVVFAHRSGPRLK